MAEPGPPFAAAVRDMKGLAWCSIDNDDSRDLDQLTLALPLADGGVSVMVAVADVSTLVKLGSAVDDHAAVNTTSVYTPPGTFHMLPERLSTSLTSLGVGEDRLALVVEMIVDSDGAVVTSNVFRAVVRNQARLSYPGVGAWLEGTGVMPPEIGAVNGLAEGLRLQEQVARQLKSTRHAHGALELETIQVRSTFDGESISGLVAETRNRAKEIIEDFMIIANGAIARYLDGQDFPILRRIVRSPERWQRIVDIAVALGDRLPPDPDAKALQAFLLRRREAHPSMFSDLSLAVVKLLGRGEYLASFPGEQVTGHFSLAVSAYSHSTAPNRRYPDLITQRLLQAALSGQPAPYGREELQALAAHCTRREDDANKVERLLRKAAAACLLDGQIGKDFDSIVTGASPKGTWVRIVDPPVEGRVTRGWEGLDVGDRVRVTLIRTDPERGFIDFSRAGHPGDPGYEVQ